MNNQAQFDFYCEEVLSRKTKVDKVFESDTILAFHHTKPSYPVHIVIVPKKHIKDLTAISDPDLPLLSEILKVARDIVKTLDLHQGARLLTNLGSFQDTPHLHFHLIQGKTL